VRSKPQEPSCDNDTTLSIELEGGKDIFNNSGSKSALTNMIHSGYMLKGAGLRTTFGVAKDAPDKGAGDSSGHTGGEVN